MAEKKDYFDFWKKLAEKNKPNRNFQKELPTHNIQTETNKAPRTEIDKNEVKIKGILEIYRKPKP